MTSGSKFRHLNSAGRVLVMGYPAAYQTAHSVLATLPKKLNLRNQCRINRCIPNRAGKPKTEIPIKTAEPCNDTGGVIAALGDSSHESLFYPVWEGC
jgi:hypothetical protein